jgi:hemerythrin-like metal-binding protein
MAYFEWTDDLLVGNKEIDHDRLTLISLVNELYDAIQEGKGTDILSQILHSLHIYTQEHFRREEILMEQSHSQEIEAHKLMHKRLLDQVVILQVAFDIGRSKVAADTAELLRYWPAQYIMLADKKLSLSIHESGLTE